MQVRAEIDLKIGCIYRPSKLVWSGIGLSNDVHEQLLIVDRDVPSLNAEQHTIFTTIRPLLVGNLFQLHRPHQIWLPHEYCHYCHYATNYSI